MKKLLLLFTLILAVCSFVFADNIGDYTINDIKDSRCKDFAKYLDSQGYFDPNSYVVIPEYGFFKTDDGDWQIQISDFTEYSMIKITFYDDSISIMRWANFDFSKKKLSDVQNAVLMANYDYANYGTVGYSSEVGDLYYISRITNKISSEALMDQLIHIGQTCDSVFTEIDSSLK